MKDRPPRFRIVEPDDPPRPSRFPPPRPNVPPDKKRPRDVAKARREAIAKVANAVSEYMATDAFEDLMYDNVTDILNARGLTGDSESDEYGREEQVIIRGALRLVAELPGEG